MAYIVTIEDVKIGQQTVETHTLEEAEEVRKKLQRALFPHVSVSVSVAKKKD